MRKTRIQIITIAFQDNRLGVGTITRQVLIKIRRFRYINNLYNMWKIRSIIELICRILHSYVVFGTCGACRWFEVFQFSSLEALYIWTTKPIRSVVWTFCKRMSFISAICPCLSLFIFLFYFFFLSLFNSSIGLDY